VAVQTRSCCTLRGLTLALFAVASQLAAGASVAATPRAELHQSHDENGVMKMRPVASLVLAPGKPATLAPGGYHVVLIDLTHALRPGDRFPLTWHFARTGDITVSAVVEKAGASEMQGPAGSSTPGMKMSCDDHPFGPAHICGGAELAL
jgi:copper(I)-binding protein